MKNSKLINEDWEYEHKRMLVFLGEDEYLARQELAQAQIEIVDEFNVLKDATKVRDISLQGAPKTGANS